MLVVIALAAAIVVVATRRDPPQPPPEVWVPASSFQKFAGRPFGPLGIGQFDVRTSPGGAKFTGWSGAWRASEASHRPLLLIFPEHSRFDRVALMFGGTVRHQTEGGYVDSGDRRDAAGTDWMRMSWLDTLGITRFEWDTESVPMPEELEELPPPERKK